MDIILISDARGQTRKLRVAPRSPWFWAPLTIVPVLVLAAAVYLGYWIAPTESRAVRVAEATALWDTQIDAQRRELRSLRDRIDNSIKALAKRVGRLQAHVTRLNAAGTRMIETAGLDADKFNFDRPPPIGGPEPRTSKPAPSVDDFEASLNKLSRKLDERERQMHVLRDLMVAGELRSKITPAGRPVDKGWISSAYGWRTDPFNGGRSLHEGIDFAAGAGADVVAVASGVVTSAERRSGYGLLVEINHGNGYVTRYGHNREAMVSVGDRVKRGQVVAKMGSTGRSTGTHVHFEVRKNGDVVNPGQYIQATR